jgi:hypothetical protein
MLFAISNIDIQQYDEFVMKAKAIPVQLFRFKAS